MIILKVSGGIGNQLFQYALGKYLSTKHNTSLVLDIEFYTKVSNRLFRLDKFNTNFKYAEVSDYNKIVGIGNNWLLWKVRNQFDKILPYYKRRYIDEKSNVFDKNILKVKDNSILCGYWQSPKYFSGFENILKDEFSLKDVPENSQFNVVKNEIENCESVSLHVRKGDYVLYNVPMPAAQYYKNAISIILNKHHDLKLFIFSDDIEWCRTEFSEINEEKYYIDASYKFQDYEELMLMSNCKHNIIANSTFSWWGAWLNLNKDKMVIYPKVSIEMLNLDLWFDCWYCVE